MLDSEKLKKQLQQYTFRENNGQIMRMVNILNPKESTLGNICYLLRGEPQEAIENSLDYLLDSGYIRIEDVNGSGYAGQLSEDNKPCRVSLTAAGIEVLMGFRESPAVDV